MPSRNSGVQQTLSPLALQMSKTPLKAASLAALATLAPTGGLPPAANAFLAQAAAQANGQMTPNNRNRVEISVDLVTAAKDELSFLAEVNKYCNLYKGPAVKNAIRRYEMLWLPLVAANFKRSKELAAPLDIAWVWHVHMLSPESYAADCKLYGAPDVIDHAVMSLKDREEALRRSREIWDSMYPKEPFDVDLDASHDSSSKKIKQFTSRLSYDLEAAIRRQRMFFYQVSLPHYSDPDFLKAAHSRYKRYLLLKKLNPNTFLVPCYDFDLIWHAHQLFPKAYKNDTKRLLGRLLNHDDSVNDRGPGSKLSTSDKTTRELWTNTFKSDFAKNGSMFRGDPPDLHIIPVPLDFSYKLATKVAEVVIERIAVENPPTDCKRFKLILNVQSQSAWAPSVKFKASPSVGCTVMQWPNRGEKAAGLLTFNTGQDTRLNISLFIKRGIFGGKGKSQMAGVSLEFASYVENCSRTEGARISRSLDLYSCGSGFKKSKIVNNNIGEGQSDLAPTGMTVQVNLRILPPKLAPYLLRLEQGEFNRVPFGHIPWGPVPISQASLSQPNQCYVALHRVLNHNSSTPVHLEIRVIHSLWPIMSAVQILAPTGECVASSHLIGLESLPLLKDLKEAKEIPVLTPGAGERAMLIKSTRDSGICVGVWEGLREAKAPTKTDPVLPSTPGHLRVTYYNLRGNSKVDLTVDSTFIFKIDDLEANLAKAIITISEESDVAEMIALTFSVAILYSLCQPVPQKERSFVCPKKMMSDMSMEGAALILAAGYLSAIPSNAYLKQLQEAAGGATFVAGLTDTASGPECESGTDGEAHPDGADGTECDAAGAEAGGACGGCGGCGN